MGVRILQGNGEGDSNYAVLYCSTSDWAFGPLFEDYEDAEAFLKWLVVDPRVLLDSDLERKCSEFRVYREEHPESEEAADAASIA